MTSRAHELYKQIVESDERAAMLTAMVSDKRTESEFLEFKGAGRIEKKEIREYWSKTLSAFANTDGGVLIWGISTTRIPNPDDPDGEIDAASGFDLAKNPVTFVQRLKDLLLEACVDPVQGVELLAVEKEADKSGFVVCLVPQGRHKPYRAMGVRHAPYFQRVGDNSVGISHSLLRSLFYPTSNASLCVESKLQKFHPTPDDHDLRRAYCSLSNKGTATARDIFVRWDDWVPDGIVEASFPWETGWSPRLDSKDRPVGVTYDEPLHPGKEVQMCCLRFHCYGAFLTDNTSDPYPTVSDNVTGKLTFFVADHPAQTFPVDFSYTDIRIGNREKRFDPVAEGD